MEDSAKNRKIRAKSSENRKKFDEDMEIIKFFAEEGKHLNISDNTLWKELKAKLSIDDSCQALKSRYRDNILPNLARYPISAFWIIQLTGHLKTGQQNLDDINLKSAVEIGGPDKIKIAAPSVTSSTGQQIKGRKSGASYPIDNEVKKLRSSARLKKIDRAKTSLGERVYHSDESLISEKNILFTKLRSSRSYNAEASLNKDLETEALHKKLKSFGRKESKPKFVFDNSEESLTMNLEKEDLPKKLRRSFGGKSDIRDKVLDKESCNGLPINLPSSRLKEDVKKKSLGEELSNSGECLNNILLNKSLTNTECLQLDGSVYMNPREILMTRLESGGKNKLKNDESILKEFEKDLEFMEMVDMVEVLMNKYDLPCEHILKILYMNNGIYEDAEHWIKFRTNLDGKFAWDEIDDMILITGNEPDMKKLLLIHGQDRIDERINYLNIKKKKI